MTRYITTLILALILCKAIYAQPKDYNLLKGVEKLEALKVYVNQNQNDTAIQLVKLALDGLDQAKTSNQDIYQISFKRLLGSVLMARGQFDSAKVWLNQALSHAQKIAAKDELGEINGVLGSWYYRTRDMESAIAHWIPSLEYLERTDKNYSLGVRFTQIGNAYLMLGNAATGIEYNRKALAVDTIKKMDFMLGRIYNSLGYGYDEIKKHDSAIYFYNQAYEIGQRTNDVERMAFAKINICSAYESQKQNTQAKACLIETIQFLKDNSLQEFLVHTYSTLVNLQISTNQFQSALASIDSINQYLKKYPDPSISIQIPQMLSMALEGKHDFEGALKHFKEYIRLQDSVLEASRRLEIEDLRIAYETEKKDEALKASKRENLLKDERNLRTRTLWIASIIALMAIMGILILAFNRRLIQRKKEIAENKVQSQLQVLKATIDGQEQERKRIAKELHDGIGQQFTAIKMAYEQLAEKVDTKAEKMSSLIEHAAQDVRTLSHQMMPRVLQEVGVEPAIRDLVEALQTPDGPTLTFTSRNMNYRLSEQQEINLYRICQELLNNAFKHANASEIEIMLYTADRNILLVIDDNGIGANKENLKGHGYMNINSRVEAMGASYTVQTALGKGYTFTLKLPL
ncbi:MAG: tetratricopeptide repeat-containing sensor histidine kinase [Bacteroidia bacterium]